MNYHYVIRLILLSILCCSSACSLKLMMTLKVSNETRISYIQLPTKSNRLITFLHALNRFHPGYCDEFMSDSNSIISDVFKSTVLCPIGVNYLMYNAWNAGSCCLSSHDDTEFVSQLIYIMAHLDSASLYSTIASENYFCFSSYSKRIRFYTLLYDDKGELIIDIKKYKKKCNKQYKKIQLSKIVTPRRSIENSHVIGFSNGAMLAQKLLCKYPFLIDSIISVGGTKVYSECQNTFTRAVEKRNSVIKDLITYDKSNNRIHFPSIYMIHSKDDDTVPIKGKFFPKKFSPFESTLDFWKQNIFDNKEVLVTNKNKIEYNFDKVDNEILYERRIFYNDSPVPHIQVDMFKDLGHNFQFKTKKNEVFSYLYELITKMYDFIIKTEELINTFYEKKNENRNAVIEKIDN